MYSRLLCDEWRKNPRIDKITRRRGKKQTNRLNAKPEARKKISSFPNF
jgi:hypothetical protein